MDYTFWNIKLCIEDNYEAQCKKAADIFADVVNRKPEGNYGFATGSSPVGFYRELIKRNKEGKIDFSKMTTFNLDEYYPFEKSNPESYYYFMMDKLFDHVNIDKTKTNLPNGETDNAALECAEYDKRILKAGGIDLQILGIGTNGHIGFNEPSHIFSEGTSVVDLAPATIEANSRFFDSYEQVPKKAISMGIKTIMMAEKILLLANGEAKTEALYQTIFGEISPKVPATILQLHRDVTLVIDKTAAAKILEKL